jgi:hypothetical protein
VAKNYKRSLVSSILGLIHQYQTTNATVHPYHGIQISPFHLKPSAMPKLITVFGATGNQGGSVIEAILADPQLSKEFKIRGITRDTTKKSAQDLAKRGVEVVTVRLYLITLA